MWRTLAKTRNGELATSYSFRDRKKQTKTKTLPAKIIQHQNLFTCSPLQRVTATPKSQSKERLPIQKQEKGGQSKESD